MRGIPVPYVSMRSRRLSTDARRSLRLEETPSIMSSRPMFLYSPPIDVISSLSSNMDTRVLPLRL